MSENGSTIRSVLDETDALLARVVPRPLRVPFHYFALRAARRGEQSMLSRLTDLCPRHGRALDVGANHGLYTFLLTRQARYVDAFEPQEECAKNLRAFASTFAHRLTVHQVALSDARGTAGLNVPSFLGRFGRATISGEASLDVQFDTYDTIVVPKERIDDYHFTDVSFIKIDVEGHESRVIAGAIDTLERCHPTLLVEIEQRHLGSKPIEHAFASMERLGYRGGFYRRGTYTDLDRFDVERDQTASFADIHDAVFEERYVNMFVFRPQ